MIKMIFTPTWFKFSASIWLKFIISAFENCLLESIGNFKALLKMTKLIVLAKLMPIKLTRYF
jgi:hypothetical protein